MSYSFSCWEGDLPCCSQTLWLRYHTPVDGLATFSLRGRAALRGAANLNSLLLPAARTPAVRCPIGVPAAGDRRAAGTPIAYDFLFVRGTALPFPTAIAGYAKHCVVKEKKAPARKAEEAGK